jgi:hypothetical protein
MIKAKELSYFSSYQMLKMDTLTVPELEELFFCCLRPFVTVGVEVAVQAFLYRYLYPIPYGWEILLFLGGGRKKHSSHILKTKGRGMSTKLIFF